MSLSRSRVGLKRHLRDWGIECVHYIEDFYHMHCYCHAATGDMVKYDIILLYHFSQILFSGRGEGGVGAGEKIPGHPPLNETRSVIWAN